MTRALLTTVHAGTAAVWLGAMLYSLLVVQPRAAAALDDPEPLSRAPRRAARTVAPATSATTHARTARARRRAARRFRAVALGLTSMVAAAFALGTVAQSVD